MNTYDLKGRTAIVTGGAKGIGRAIAELLAASGAIVRIWDREAVQASGFDSDVVDVSDERNVAAAVRRLPASQTPDVLVNSAGYLGRAQRFVEHDAGDWQRIVAVNLVGAMRVTQAILPRMIKAGRGRILNMASLAGKEGVASIAAYSGASGGVISFSKALSREVAAHGVLVNCIAPGPIDTDMIRSLGADVVNGMISDSPLKRLGEPQEVAHLVAWLASDASRFNTGAVFDMSGGRARY